MKKITRVSFFLNYLPTIILGGIVEWQKKQKQKHSLLKKQLSRYTNSLVEKALKAEKVYATYTQEQVDKIVAAMALAGSEASLQLAKEAHEETGRGVVEDKDTKNHFATEYVYERIKMKKRLASLVKIKLLAVSKLQHHLVSWRVSYQQLTQHQRLCLKS